MYHIHTDGSCLKNIPSGGPGGIGCVVVYNGLEIERSVGFYRTTNNRMEMMAIVMMLEELQQPTEVMIFTDSEYTINSVTKWVYGWMRNNWISSTGKPVQNKDLVIRIWNLMRYHDVRFTKVKGHSGEYFNELCDKLAKEAAKNPTMVDEGFIVR